jgi:hypothetical protein
MTEEEAKTKLCVQRRTHEVRKDHMISVDPIKCVGSDCMAWRGVKATGYCGLAGKPS